MLEFLITALCLKVDPMYNNACLNALKATTIQIHLKQDVDAVQQRIEKRVVETTGPTVWQGALFYYQLIDKKELQFNTSFKPVSDNLMVSGNDQILNITLTWTF